MSVIYKENPNDKLLEIIVDGKITKKEFDEIAPQVESFIKAHGKIKILEIIKNFSGFELSAFSSGIKFDLKHLKDFSHCAVITDSNWLGPFTRVLAPLFSVSIKIFKLEEEDKARSWLKNA